MFFIDPLYIFLVLIPTLVLSAGAQMYLMSTFNKWRKVRNTANLTGAQVGQVLISRTSLSAGAGGARLQHADGPASGAQVTLERTGGTLTDHYDPSTHTVRMSDAVAGQPSVVAMAVVAHELGHAQQHQEKSILIAMRSFLLPAVRFSPMLSYGMIFAGLIFNITGLFWLGILFFGLMVLFSILTLPVEIDASMRGLRMLREVGLMQSESDEKGSRSVLTAAAMTYIAAAVTAVLQLLYYISLARR